MRKRWPISISPSLLCACLAAGPWAAAQEEQEEQEETEDASQETAGAGESAWDRLWADPTLNGKLHLTYRLSYTARIYQFSGYDLPFPGSEGPPDEEHEAQHVERHEDVSDQDLDQYFAFRLDSLPVLEGRSPWIQSVAGDASFRYFKDLDGSPAGEEAQGFLDDRSGRAAFQLYTLNSRLETLNRHLELTLGRQFAREAEWLHFDGATATLRGVEAFWREVEITGFAGSRATWYSHSASSHDAIYGGHFKIWPLPGTRLRFSDVYYIDNSFEAEARQELGNLGWAALLYRMVNEDPHSLSLETSLEWQRQEVTLHAYYLGKLGESADDFNFDYTQSSRRRSDGDKDRYFNIGDLHPYDELQLELRKGFRRKYGVFAGGSVHRLRARDEEDNYNTDWQEVWAGADMADPWWRGLTGRGTIRYVRTELPRKLLRIDAEDALSNGVPDFREEDITGDGEPSHLGLELLLEQDFQRRVAVGSTLVLRAYDYESNFAELGGLTASSVGAHVRWWATDFTQLFLGYTYDTDYRFINPDLDAVHTLRLQLMLRL